MWLSRFADWEWEGLIYSAGLIILAFGVQVLILYRIGGDRSARSIYAVFAAATVPVCWGVSPCWHDPLCYPIATFLGWPVTVHAVPLLSFYRGLALRRSDRLGRWPVEMLLLLLIGVPVWYYVWSLTQVFVLGFCWI
jgi:hypothetical protein